jgi:hypothetical protein
VQEGYRVRIHWGTGRFCRAALASLTFVRKDLWDGMVTGSFVVVVLVLIAVGVWWWV